MVVEVQINGSQQRDARYITYAPAPCHIRQTSAATTLTVTLTSRPAKAGGGEAVFYATPGAASQDTLTLALPADGGWVPFLLGGKWQRPSIEDGDCLLAIDGPSVTQTVALMVRLRKNANSLTASERNRFLAALAKLNNRGAGKYQVFRNMHVDAADREEHRGPHFLPWHRAYLLDVERSLQAIDPSVSLHYWRFDQPAPRIFRSSFMGATVEVPEGEPGEPVVFDSSNPLSAWATDGVAGISRSAYFRTESSAASGQTGFPVKTQAQTLATGNEYQSFTAPPQPRLGIESSPHGAAHVSFGGSISVIDTAVKDPLFFMLHSNVDRLWALWQWLNRRVDPGDIKVYQGQNQDGRRLDDSLWPWNGVTTPPRPDFAPGQGLAPTPTTAMPGAQPTIRRVLDDQGHVDPAARCGAGYDTVPYEFQ